MREFEEVVSTGPSVKEVCLIFRFCPVILDIDVCIEGGYTERYKVER